MLNLVGEELSANIANHESRWFGLRPPINKQQASSPNIARFAVGIAVPILLAASATLQAQCDPQKTHREGQEPLTATTAPGFRSSNAPIALLSQGINTGTEGPTPARVGPFVFSETLCVTAQPCRDNSSDAEPPWQALTRKTGPDKDGNQPEESSKAPAVVALKKPPTPGINESVFYKNRLEFSLDGGWLPINIPFVFDVFMGDAYTMTSLKYTLVPVIASLRWQMNNVDGAWIFRGNWDLETSAGFTFIPRGPETRYISWIMGVRRNFVPRRGRIAPYFDGRLGLGDINAKEPSGVLYAQGQDFTFTVNMGSGVRYNFNSRYSISAGLNWMHISNLYLSEPKFSNYGINVYGPMFGIDVRLGKPRLHSSQ